MRIFVGPDKNFLFLFGVFALALGALLVGVFESQIWASYVEHIRGAHLRQALGFETGWVTDAHGEPECWGITHVEAGGLLERAGVRAGARPIRISSSGDPNSSTRLYYHGTSSGIIAFYGFLERRWSAGHVDFSVCPSCEPCGPPEEHWVSITVPK